MKLGPRLRVLWIPWWDVDHHRYGCPVTVSFHTPGLFLEVRPFSGFAQGGDLRNRTDLHGYLHTARWLLKRENPQIWASLDERLPRSATCARCLHDAQTCAQINGLRWHEPHLVRRLPFVRHLWRYHVRRRVCHT